MYRLLSATLRMSPRIVQAGLLAYGYHFYLNYLPHRDTPMCFFYRDTHGNNIFDKISNKPIRIIHNSVDVGAAYCVSNDCIVTASQNIPDRANLEFVVAGQTVKGTFRVIGTFENLTLFHFRCPDITPLSEETSPISSVAEVQIVSQHEYLRIKNGYMVGRDAGFAMIDGVGDVGSVVIKQGKPVGIVTHIGCNAETGYLRAILWADIMNLRRRLKQEPLYLGVSASACSDRAGLSLIRVASNSPLKSACQIGDIITQVNHQRVRSPEDLTRTIMLSGETVALTIERNGTTKVVDIVI